MAESPPRVPHVVPNRQSIIVTNASFGPFVDLVNVNESNNVSSSLTPSPSITAPPGGVPSPPASIPSSVMRRVRSSSRVVGAGGQTTTATTTATTAAAPSIPLRQGRSDSQASISSDIKVAADRGNEVSRSSFAEAAAAALNGDSNTAPGVFVSNGSMSVQPVGRPLTPRSRPPATSSLTREGSSNNNDGNKEATASSPLLVASPLSRHTSTTISRNNDSAYSSVPKTPTSTSKRIAAKDEAPPSNTPTQQQQQQQPVPSQNENATRENEDDYTYVPPSAQSFSSGNMNGVKERERVKEERDAVTAGTPQRNSDGGGGQQKGTNNAASPDAIRRFEERVRLYSATRSLRTERKLNVPADAAVSEPRNPLLAEDTTNPNTANNRMSDAFMKTPVAYVRSVNNGQVVTYHVSRDDGSGEEDARSAAVASTRAPSAADESNLAEYRTQSEKPFIDTTDHNVVSARRLGIVPSSSPSEAKLISAADSPTKPNSKLVYSYEFEAALATVKARVARTERDVSHSRMKDVGAAEGDEELMAPRGGTTMMRKGGSDYTQNFSLHAAAASPSSFVSANRFASAMVSTVTPSRVVQQQRRTVTASSSPSKGLFGNMYDDRYTNNNNLSTISGVSPLTHQTPCDSLAATPTPNGFGRAARTDEGTAHPATTQVTILSPPPPAPAAAIEPSSSITLASREDFMAALRREGGSNIQRDRTHQQLLGHQPSHRHVGVVGGAVGNIGGPVMREVCVEGGDSSVINPFDHTAKPHTAAVAAKGRGAAHSNQISFAASTANTNTGTTATSFGGDFSTANGDNSGAWMARSRPAEDRHYNYSIANSHYLNPRYAYAADSTSAFAAPPPALTHAKVERHAYGAEPTSPNYARAVKQANKVDLSLSYSASRRPRLTSVETIY